MNVNQFIAVQNDGEGVLGKLLYFSLGSLLINKDTFNQIGQAMDLPNTSVSRTSMANAFKSATGDVYDRKVIAAADGGSKIVKIYCRDNDQSERNILRRELVLETLGAETNHYTKLANLYMNKDFGVFDYDVPSAYPPEADGLGKSVYDYCDQASELFNLYRDCVRRGQIETVLERQLERMQSTKVSYGKIYFCPRSHMQLVDVFEQYIEELNRNNLKSGAGITVNSLFVVDDEKQRGKMASGFYEAVKKEIELYNEKLEYLIRSESQSPAIMNRWVLKVQELEGKKRNYEEILQRDFDNLNSEFDLLRLQAQELQVRASKLQKCA